MIIIKNNNYLKKYLFNILLLCLLVSFANKKYFSFRKVNAVAFNGSYQFKKDDLLFKLINYNNYYSNKLNLAKTSFELLGFDSNSHTIIPSDLTLIYNLHILCFFTINNTINISSLPIVEEDKHFKCVLIHHQNDNIQNGFIIYETKSNNIIKNNFTSFLFENNFFNYNYKSDSLFDSIKINHEYRLLVSQIQNKNISLQSKRLKSLYFSNPVCSSTVQSIKTENKWNYINIFNEYFCVCKGSNCLNIKISNKCKYFLYLYIIDKNSYVYKKTDYLLMDFIFKRFSSDDVYPIFEEMINRNLSAHYMTEKDEINVKYCKNKKRCNTIIYADEKNYRIDDNFIEKHLTLILKLKQVISSVGVNINYINNLFYNIDYITYICIGHGVSYFKYYLYKRYYGPQNFDKLLIPNSERLISMTIKYGWKDENLIKLNLPRWDKYNIDNNSLKGNIKYNSIFIMFTWRELKYGGRISYYYILNILNLLNNEQLINNLVKHNIILYFTLHHKVLKYKQKFKTSNNIKYIQENDIAECLSKTNLVVTDFSSIIFDMIYRKKPYIIYIPDAKDEKIKNNYKKRCYSVIKKFTSNEFEFENVYFDINSTINKINYYIDNDFQLENTLIKFYDDFNFTKGNIINNFINFISKI